MRKRQIARTAAVASAAALALAPTVASAADSAPPSAPPAAAVSADPLPVFDFRDCPALPAGVDPAAWRCEVLVAEGSMTLGGTPIGAVPMTLTHAEGPMPDGAKGQVWGGMRSAAVDVPGGLFGTPVPVKGLGLSLQPVYGGYSDFYAVGDNLGVFTMRFEARSRLLPTSCVIGADAPVEFRLKRVGPSQVVSKDPVVIAFEARDDAFTVPEAQGCGPLGGWLNRRLGLPAASGNSVSYSAHYTFRTYDRLPAS
ncbi:hypothetical protein [Yinghuangia seranimata]|uniref:hypothetical protein n=1 Tax=Yinghuangia seranimata TaxID=408067 RepID=UPI00248C90FA|nr:hypothetical protein [Yinghuangia seranimata]MDI2125579.1 hypothetical protein [Yinghuangia seranimata]